MSQHLAEPAALSPPPFILPVEKKKKKAHLAQLVGVQLGVKMALEKNGTRLLLFLPVEYGRDNLTSLNFQQMHVVE